MVYATRLHVLMAIGVALSVVQAAPTQSSINNQAICTTPQCVLTAAGIINDMDPEIDPCQDFRQFACGGFDERNEIPADTISAEYFSIIYNDNSRVVRSISDVSLGKVPKPAAGDAAEESNLKKLHDLYASCMDEATILKAGRKPVADLVHKVLESLPGNKTAGVDKSVLAKALGHVSKLGLISFIAIVIMPDGKEPTINSLVVAEGGLGLPAKSLYEVPVVVELYQGIVAQMFQIIMGDEDVANRTEPLLPKDIKQEWLDVAKDVVAFETQLAAIGTEIVDQRDPLKAYTTRTAEELLAITPLVDWPLLVQEILPAGTQYNRTLLVNSVPYVTKLDTVLKNTTTTTLQHYFSWLAIRTYAKSLGEPYKQPLTALFAGLNGMSPNVKVDRWKTCVSTVNTNVGEIVGHYFIKERFKGNSRQDFTEIIESLRGTYTKAFPAYDWLDKSTLDGALKKLAAIEPLVGYSTGSPDVPSTKSLQEYYEGYDVTVDDYFGNMLKYATWQYEKMMTQAGKTVDRKKMLTTPQTVNAFYSPYANQVLFPAGMLQFPYYHVENPEYVNYGAMGSIAGHEITHGFDSMGSHFDSQGAFRNWWTNETRMAFNDKAKCFVDQYNNFTIEGPNGSEHNVDGALTLNENIADNGGLKQTFRTWQNRHNSDRSGKKYKNFKLPGLDKYTPEQLFFISYGRLWCAKMRPEAEVQTLKTDTHSPTKWRINAPVMNLPEFSEVFKCKAGSPMNPVKKCELW
ncbi:hypothetical protein BG015_009027 [Linnemannia schmuckeri]|uniref:Zincin n=1 Tax=Linnemannia schmuckeri TaxID=64567 RepID=A0A9P5RW39_9FUNG|nr:hypothetical protein BG015_009027 [Linnemannia schmuckeri]